MTGGWLRQGSSRDGLALEPEHDGPGPVGPGAKLVLGAKQQQEKKS